MNSTQQGFDPWGPLTEGCEVWHNQDQLGCWCILDKGHDGPHCCQNGTRY